MLLNAVPQAPIPRLLTPPPRRRLPARAGLIAALEARLDARYNDCAGYSLRWLASRDVTEMDAIARDWDRAFDLAEATRKALIRSQESMPYWKWARQRNAQLAAEGFFGTAGSRSLRTIGHRAEAPPSAAN